MARPHIEPYVELDQPYKRFGLPALPKGAWYKVLSLDPDSGACSLKVRLEPKFRRPPGFAWSDLEVFLLRGALRVGGQWCGEGQYFFVPAGYALGELSSPEGCEALFFWNDGPPTYAETDQHHPLALTEAYVATNSYEDAPWITTARVQPGVATGCAVKPLRVDPLSRATTFLYSMVPAYRQDNISYHDCAEESYHVWGTSWMLQFGDIPTGGYFWRPPYINHGAFASRRGCIALGRTDSELQNYFHYNPWTTPDQNAARAAAQLYRRRPQLWDWTVMQGHNHPAGPPDFEMEKPCRR